MTLEANTLFTSDTHFDHNFAANSRGFANTADMNESLLVEWNSKATDSTTIVHCGDFCWHKRTIKEIVPKLKGTIILVLGNHDRSMEREYEKYGIVTTLMLSVKIKDIRIECCHFPLWSWDRMQHGAWHIHGHEHGDRTGVPGRIHDVGIDNNNQKLLTLAELEAIMEPKQIRSHHGK